MTSAKVQVTELLNDIRDGTITQSNVGSINLYYTDSAQHAMSELKGITLRLNDELLFLEKNYANFTWDGLRKAINPLQKRIADIQDALKLVGDTK